MHRRADLINWAMLLIVSVGTTVYLVSASRLVANEQEVAAVWTSVGASEATSEKIIGNQEKKSMDEVLLKTNFGMIELSLYRDKAPNTVDNFLKLTKSGFYDGTRFHRVIKGFMIQGGDPNSKDDDWSNDGIGGPGYVFKDEINSNKIIRGVLAMANAGPNTNGSQFFIVTAESAPWLDGKHTIFGKVIGGIDVVDKIENSATDKTKNDHPVENVTVE